MNELKTKLWCGKDVDNVAELTTSISLPKSVIGINQIQKWQSTIIIHAPSQNTVRPIESFDSEFDALVSAMNVMRVVLRNYLVARSFKLFKQQSKDKLKETNLESLFATQDYTPPKNFKTMSKMLETMPVKDTPPKDDSAIQQLMDVVNKNNIDYTKGFSAGHVNLKVPRDLRILWAHCDGENNRGLLKPDYKLLSSKQTITLKVDKYNAKTHEWLHDVYPILKAPNNYLLCFKASDLGIYAINLMWEEVYKVAASLDDYLLFLRHAHENNIYRDKSKEADLHPDDPVNYLDSELKILKNQPNIAIYPLLKDKSTVLDWLFE
jgi:hypothetical protein